MNMQCHTNNYILSNNKASRTTVELYTQHDNTALNGYALYFHLTSNFMKY